VAGGAAAATRIKSGEANSEIAPRSYYAVSFGGRETRVGFPLCGVSKTVPVY
jgi:hypothetical protein